VRRFLANAVGVILLAGLIAAVVAVWRLGSDDDQRTIVVSPLGLGSREAEPLYPKNDPWAAYLAPESVCPGGEDRSAPIEEQKRTMVCLLNWARQRRGLSALPVSDALSEAARRKAEDIRRCSDFAHEACGKDARAVAEEAGYAGSVWGENLYAGPGEFGRPRVAVDGWLNSDGHRENLFRDLWEEQGVALLPVGSFKGASATVIWVSHFGRS
jgi:uncharacterized protein YkwD